MLRNNLFCNARIQLKDGSMLNEHDPHVLATILHTQLHTKHRRFSAKRPTAQKASRPAHVSRPEQPKTMKQAASTMDNLIRYH
jgi:hypothetical protein